MFDPRHVDLLITDDDGDFRQTVVRRFLRRGFRVEEAASGEEALARFARRQFDVAVLDMVMPGLSGLEVLERLTADGAECEVLLLTGQGTIETAVQAMKLGAYDYLTKPFPLAELEVLIQKAWERRQLARENRQLKAVLEHIRPRWEMVGRSPEIKRVFRLIDRAGPSERAILILGESGTGKELVARALHESSPRADRPLVAVNCAALPEQLLESELFGHERGAFTGATVAKPGLFEMADGGTLFIDEIGEMPPAMQAKLLRVLEDGSLRRVGSVQERRVDVRLVSATNCDLQKAVDDGRFREDLFYRINVLSIPLPPLRERRGDVPLLVSKFLEDGWEISGEALRILERCDWPGNVRQLINAIERAKILAETRTIVPDDLPPELAAERRKPSVSQTGGAAEDHLAVDSDDLTALQRAKVVEVLKREQGNKSRAARKLGISRRALYRLLEKYELAATTFEGLRDGS